MECFKHHGSSAVGLCKSCGKGVCRTCAIEVSRGLACSEACKPFAESLSRLQLTSFRNIGLLAGQRFMQPLFALVFLAAGIWFLSEGGGVHGWLMLAMGLVMAISGIISWRSKGVETSRGVDS